MSESAISVAVRTRPLDKDEESLPDGMMTFEGASLCMQNKNYTFDYVFAPGVTNKDVYDNAVSERICHIFEGCNVTILAYGSTGSGKTYTMGTNYDSSEKDPDIGIIPRCIQEIFRVMGSRRQSMDFTVKVSFLELYREEIFDLLQKPPVQCALREDLDGFKVANLTEVPVNSVEDAFMTLKKGCIARKTCATAKNSNSSRSHGLFSVHIEQTDKITLSFKRSKFQLVDLAGSERMASSKTTGVQVKEGININLGLLTLGNVISKLAEDKKQHIPFRNSKLTRLLQDSLGGNSHTVMIACINPSNLNVEETLSTLRYASCARAIKNRPQVNLDPPAVQIEKLKKQLQALQSSQGKSERIYNVQEIGTNTTEVCGHNEEIYRELQKAYIKITNLCQQLTKFQDKNSEVIDGFRSINEKLKLLIAELTAEAAADENLHQFLKSLEDIHQEIAQLLVNQGLEQHTELISEASGDCESSNLEDKSIDVDSEQVDMTIEEINAHNVSSKKLCDISECITLKTGIIKNLEDYFRTVETVDQDYVSGLVEKINKLVSEKEALQGSLKSTAEKMEKKNQSKITQYELEIKELQKELRGKKIILQTKEENQRKIKCLQNEIESLKRMKVDLAKQLKEGSTKYMRLQREKDKEVAKLVKDSRKKEFEFTKLKSKLESQLNVLKKRLDLVQKKSLSKGMDTKKLKSSQTHLEPIEKRIDHVLEVIVGLKIAEVNSKEAEELKSLIPSLQTYQSEAGRNLTKEEEECIKEKIDLAKSCIQSLIDQNAEQVHGTQHYNENEVILNLLNSVKTLSESKLGIQHLFKQHISAVEKCKKDSNRRYIELTKEYQEEVSSYLDQIKQLSEQTTQQQSELDSVKMEWEAKVIQERQETVKLRKELVEVVQNLINEQQKVNQENADSVHDSNLQEKVQLQDEMIDYLKSFSEDYKKKLLEVQQLSQQVFNAKKGKRVTWLGDLTNKPSTATTTMVDETYSILDEYLNDTLEESFSNDPNDPDYRGTPMYKRKLKTSRKISPEISDDDDAPPVKKYVVGCNCTGECRTMRCKCKKKNIDCSSACVCDKEHCMNIQSCSTVPSTSK